MVKGRRRFTLGGVGLVAVASAVTAMAMGTGAPDWKGSESFSVSVLEPNLARCGAPPDNLEGRFSGSGIDTAGGPFTVTASACVNVATLHVSDLEATDRYTRTGDTVLIETDDFTLMLDDETCVASNPRPVKFRVAGGTGALAGAKGSGYFDIALNWLPCSGLNQPAHVWFKGGLQLPG